jgi:hypothetical protein
MSHIARMQARPGFQQHQLPPNIPKADLRDWHRRVSFMSDRSPGNRSALSNPYFLK